jgi:hypothetical protein
VWDGVGTEVDVSSKTQRRRQILKAVNGFISSGRERNHDNEFLDPDHKLKVNSSSNMHHFAEDGRDHDARSGGGCGGSFEGLGMPLRPQMHSQEERWWHLPDSIQDVLPLPKRFEFHLEVLPHLSSWIQFLTKFALRNSVLVFAPLLSC